MTTVIEIKIAGHYDIHQVKRYQLSPEAKPLLELNCHEAALALHALQEYCLLKGCEISPNTTALMQKLNDYL
jgi:hypothetical protein